MRYSIKTLYCIAGLASLVLSYWAYHHSPIMNPDGICYLESAKAIATQPLHDVMGVCAQSRWPLYSYLIFGFHKLGSLSVMHAAYSLNAIFSLITVLTFITLVRVSGATLKICSIAAAIILIAHDMNSVRDYVIRDHGFWAFYTLSMLFLFFYLQQKRMIHAIAWSVCLMLATLFRIEAAVFLLFAPVVIFSERSKLEVKLKSFLQLHLPLVIVGVSAVVIKMLMLKGDINLSRFSEFSYQLTHFFSMMQHNFTTTEAQLTQHVFNRFNESNVAQVTALFLGAWYVQCVISSMTLSVFGLLMYGWMKKIHAPNAVFTRTVLTYSLLALTITFIYLVQNMFISKRYILALTLCLLLWIPATLNYLHETYKQRKGVFFLIILMVVANNISGVIDFGYSKQYMRDAAEWLKLHSDTNAKIYSNDMQVLYYSDRIKADFFQKMVDYESLRYLTPSTINQFDFFAIRQNKHDKQVWIAPTQFRQLKTFINKRNDQVIIYERVKEVK